MPLFDYKCTKCGKEFEELVKDDTVVVLCPACGEKSERIYYGKVDGSFGKKSHSCSGHCSTCGGCK